MPHIMQESHLESICSQCRKPHGNNITLQFYHHKIYEIFKCQNCGYEIIRLKGSESGALRMDVHRDVASKTK